MGGKKISGVLPKCETKDNKCYLWIGIGVNINGTPAAGSTSLKEQLGCQQDIEIVPFIDKLSAILMKNVKRLRSLGFKQSLKPEIEKRLEFFNQEVNIFDIKLETVLHSGTFIGINEYGHAIIQKEGKQVVVSEGRMRAKSSK